MNKKDVAITVGICAIGWAAFPIILKLLTKIRENKNVSKNAKGEVGSKTVETEDASTRGS
jgi:hypothetical protein